MNMPITETVKSRIETAVALAGLLERVEHHAVQVGAAQYQSLVRQVGHALQQEMPEAALQAVLGAYPAAATVYENLHYERSGLSRSPLERSINAELLATEVLARAARRD
jgi:hypothetical protein